MEIINESEPSEIEALKDREEELMRRDAQKMAPQKPESPISSNYSLSPAEHELIGSRTTGLVFFPNKPLGLWANKSLEQINNQRESYQNYLFTIKISDHAAAVVEVKLLPLTQEKVDNPDGDLTFELKGVKQIIALTQEEREAIKIDLPEIEQLIKERLKKAKAESLAKLEKSIRNTNNF